MPFSMAYFFVHDALKCVKTTQKREIFLLKKQKIFWGVCFHHLQSHVALQGKHLSSKVAQCRPLLQVGSFYHCNAPICAPEPCSCCLCFCGGV